VITVSFKAQRDLLLTAIYVEAKANRTAFVDTRPQAKRLDIDDALLDSFLSYYIQKGLAINEGLATGSVCLVRRHGAARHPCYFGDAPKEGQ
jgi:hypothetical protein